MNELRGQHATIYRHHFNGVWQRAQINDLKENLPEGWGLVFLDFAENFLCKFQEEAQSAYWAYKQVSLFPAVIYYHCTAENCRKIVRDEICFITDDKTHDANVAQHCIENVIAHVQAQTGGIKKVVLASDGCAAQFKSRLPFLHLLQMQPKDKSFEVERLYYGSRHGKNDCDWSGGAIKRTVTRNLASGLASITDAEGMHEHCTKFLTQGYSVSVSEDTDCTHQRRKFELVSTVDRSLTSKDVKTVKGCRDVHQVRATGSLQLGFRQLACFCSLCTEKDADGECENLDVVGSWKNVKVDVSMHVKENFASEPESQPDIDSDSESDSSLSDDESVVHDPVLTDASSDSEKSDSDSEDDSDHVDDGESGIPVFDQQRSQFFDMAFSTLSSCKTFPELQASAQEWQNRVDASGYDLSPCNVEKLVNLPTDACSLSLLDETSQKKVLALRTASDGNCLYRAISILFFGSEEHYKEFRVRCALALVLKQNLFLEGKHWVEPHEKLQPDEVLRIALLTASQMEESPTKTLESEAMTVLKDKEMAGLFEIFALAMVLQRPIQSVYPSFGREEYRPHCNRTIRPPNCASELKVYVMWTNTSGSRAQPWANDHFVPLVFRKAVKVPKRGSFHKILHGTKEYVCAVCDSDELWAHVAVKFMHEKQSGLYYWPTEDDYSWEPVTSLRGKVTVTLNENRSNNRCVFFTVE